MPDDQIRRLNLSEPLPAMPSEAPVAVPAAAAPAAPEPVPDGIPRVPRDPLTGGITNTLSLADALKLYGIQKSEGWVPKPNRYYFSGTMKCFLKEWMKRKNDEAEASGLPIPYPPEGEYTTGNSEAGNAVEQRLIHIWRSVYGDEGVVLKDIRFSKPLPTGICQNCGHGYHYAVNMVPGGVDNRCRDCPCNDPEQEMIAFIGKSDPILIGDNFEVLEFNEIKSQLMFAKKYDAIARTMGREVPLAALGINDADGEGAMNIDQLCQLAVGVKWLTDKGLRPKKAKLTQVWRGNFDDHLAILLSTADAEFLYQLAEWWVREHHASLKKDTPPAPTFFMGYECRYCPFQKSCPSNERQIHPIMRGINERLRDANRNAKQAVTR